MSILETRPKGAPGRDKPVPHGSCRGIAIGVGARVVALLAVGV